MFNLFGPHPSMYGYPRQQYVRQPYRNYNPYDSDEDESFISPSWGMARRSPPRVQQRVPQSSIRVVPHDEEEYYEPKQYIQPTITSPHRQYVKPHNSPRHHQIKPQQHVPHASQQVHPLFRQTPQYPQRRKLMQEDTDSDSEEEQMPIQRFSPKRQSPPRPQMQHPRLQQESNSESDEESIPIQRTSPMKQAFQRNIPEKVQPPAPMQQERPKTPEAPQQPAEPAQIEQSEPSSSQQPESAPQEQPQTEQPAGEPSEEDKLTEEEREIKSNLKKIEQISLKVDDLSKDVESLKQECDTRPVSHENEKYWWNVRKAEELLTQQLLALDSVIGGDEIRKVRKDQVLRVQGLLNEVDQIRKISEPTKSE